MNPLAQPATILGPNPARQAHRGLVDKVLADVEAKRQREELKAAQVDEALLPPDIDVKDAFQYEIDEITGDLDAYINYKADLVAQGIDITSPQYKSEFYKTENAIRGKTIKSKQHQDLYKKAVETIATNPEDIDVEATQARLAEFVAAANQGVDAAHDVLSKYGSLYVEKPFDIAAYGNDIAGQYEPSIVETDPQRKGSFLMSETVTDVTPENKLGAGIQFMRKPKAKQQVEYEYSALSRSVQAEYERKALAAGGEPGSGVMMYATERYLQPHWKTGRQVTAQNLPSGNGSGTKEEVPQSNMLVDMVVGTLGENPNYVKRDAQGYMVAEGFTGQAIGQYNSVQKEAKGQDANGNIIYEEKASIKPILIQKVVKNPKDGYWYVQTNDSVENKKGITVGSDKFMQRYTPAQFKDLMYKLATQTGEWTSGKIDAYAESKGYYNPDKSLNVQQPGSNEVDIYFNGKTEMVPRSSGKKVNGVMVYPTSSGTWVKWNEASKSWIKSNYQGEGSKTSSTSTKSGAKVYKGLDENGNPIFE